MRIIDYTQYVDTNIGTIGHLLQATAPTVQSPHGAALVEPVFRAGMKDRYFSDKIFGFTAGHAIVMPTVAPGDYMACASAFDHDFEVAKPDHYEVLLEDSGIREKHTACDNRGVFVFDYPQGDAYITVYVKDCSVLRYEEGFLFAEGSQEFVGPMATVLKVDALKAEFFDTELPNSHKPEIREAAKAVRLTVKGGTVCVPFAISPMGLESARKSFRESSYEEVLADCKARWNEVLGKVRVEGGSEQRLRSFYTAIYRATSRMHNYSVDGLYRGFDGKVHEDGGFGYHCDDGIWDTYRGMHPLQLILEPKAHRDTVESYLRMYKDSGWLPRFPRLGGDRKSVV